MLYIYTVLYKGIFVYTQSHVLLIPALNNTPLQIDHSASKSFLGFIVASFSFGQLLTSPLIGMWSNYRPIKEPLVITLLISTGGYLMYSYAGALEHVGKWVLITSRFIMGLAAGKSVYLCLHFFLLYNQGSVMLL